MEMLRTLSQIMNKLMFIHHRKFNKYPESIAPSKMMRMMKMLAIWSKRKS